MTTMAHATPSLAALRYRLADLREDERAAEYSNFSYTNGTMRRIRGEIIDVLAEIKRRENLA